LGNGQTMENTKKLSAVFLDLGSLDNDDLDLSDLQGCLSGLTTHTHVREEDVVQLAANAEVLICNKVPVRRYCIEQLPNLKLICVCATGVNNIDLEAARERGIQVSNVRSYATPSVVQHAFMLILNLLTSFRDYQTAITNQAWQRAQQFCLLDYPINELAGKTLGIVGFGELGKGMVEPAKAFGMRILVAERAGREAARTGRVKFESVLQQSDVLTLHCPLTPSTRDLIGAKELAMMKSEAILINVARGGVVDEAALLQALHERKIAGAGIDVLSVEPPAQGNPLLECDLPNLIVTPHIAWASRQARQRLVQEMARNIRDFSVGKARNAVLPDLSEPL